MSRSMIPKIIHQTAPSDRSHWHPLWSRCQQSWLDQHPDFEYKFWNDDDIDRLVRDHYPEYWTMYQEFPIHIMRIDFVRFCMLHRYGGIYADMDYYCYQNFHHELVDDAYLVENCNGNDALENSLMCSQPQSSFFRYCMDLTQQRYQETKAKDPALIDHIRAMATNPESSLVMRPLLIFYISGTNLVTSAWRMAGQRHSVATLDGRVYNNHCLSYHPDFRAKHAHTHIWGREDIDMLKHLAGGMPTHHAGVSVDEFDFYRDYTDGEYQSLYRVNWDNNHVNDELSPNMSYDS